MLRSKGVFWGKGNRYHLPERTPDFQKVITETWTVFFGYKARTYAVGSSGPRAVCIAHARGTIEVLGK
jgi:hypothetical protein